MNTAETIEQRLTALLNDPITRLVDRNIWFQAQRALLVLRSIRIMDRHRNIEHKLKQ